MDGFLNRILMEAVSILLLGGLGEVADLLAFIFLKDWRSCKSIPERLREKGFNVFLCLWRNGTVSFIHDKGHSEPLDFVRITLVKTLVKLAHHGGDFLDGGYHHTLIITT